MIFTGATFIAIILIVTLIFTILLAMIRGKPAPTEWPIVILAFLLAYKLLEITGVMDYISKILGVQVEVSISGAVIVTLIIIFVMLGLVYVVK